MEKRGIAVKENKGCIATKRRYTMKTKMSSNMRKLLLIFVFEIFNYDRIVDRVPNLVIAEPLNLKEDVDLSSILFVFDDTTLEDMVIIGINRLLLR